MKKKAFTWLVILAMFVSVFAGMSFNVLADGEVEGLPWESFGGAKVEVEGDHYHATGFSANSSSPALEINGRLEELLKDRDVVTANIKFEYCGTADVTANVRFRWNTGGNDVGAVNNSLKSSLKFNGDWQQFEASVTVTKSDFELASSWKVVFSSISNIEGLCIDVKNATVERILDASDVEGLEWKSYNSTVTRAIVKDDLTNEYCYAFTGSQMNHYMGLPLYDAISKALPDTGTGKVRISYDFRIASDTPITISGVTAMRDGTDASRPLGDISPTSGNLKFTEVWNHVEFVVDFTNFTASTATHKDKQINADSWARFNTSNLNNQNYELRFKNTVVERAYGDEDVEGLSWDKQSNVVKNVKFDSESNEAYYSFTGFTNSTDRYNCIKSASVYEKMKEILGNEGTGWVKFSFDYAVEVTDGTAPFTGFRSRGANVGDIMDSSGTNIILDGKWHTAVGVLHFNEWVSGKNEKIVDGTYLCTGTLADGKQGNIQEIKIKNTKIEKGRAIDVQLEISNSLTFKMSTNVTDFTKSYMADNVTMKLTRNGHTDEVIGTEEEGSGRFCFEYKVNPQCMGDDITMVLCVGDKEYDLEKTCSVKAYCEKLHELFPNDDELNRLLADMLTYGAKAQKFAEYETDNLVTAGLDWVGECKSKEVTISAESIIKNTAEHGDFIKGASLSLGDTVRIFFKVMAEQADSAELYTDEAMVEPSEIIPDDDYTYIYTDGIYYNNLDKVYKLKIDEHYVEYNANAYIAAKYNDEKVGDIIIALAAYGDSAKAYSEQVKGSDQ